MLHEGERHGGGREGDRLIWLKEILGGGNTGCTR